MLLIDDLDRLKPTASIPGAAAMVHWHIVYMIPADVRKGETVVTTGRSARHPRRTASGDRSPDEVSETAKNQLPRKTEVPIVEKGYGKSWAGSRGEAPVRPARL
jgi:hypothetical protein